MIFGLIDGGEGGGGEKRLSGFTHKSLHLRPHIFSRENTIGGHVQIPVVRHLIVIENMRFASPISLKGNHLKSRLVATIVVLAGEGAWCCVESDHNE